MKSFSNYITESVLDLPRNSLDPAVFQFDDGRAPVLNPAIKLQILTDITNFEKLTPVKRVYIVGSILTKTYAPDSDIDVNVEVFKEDIDDLQQARISMTQKGLNGKLAIGTTHPINYYITTDELDPERFDAVYEVVTEQWLKEPSFFDLKASDYVDKFENIVIAIDLSVSKLRRELMDYDRLTKLTNREVKGIKKIINRKLMEMTDTIKMLIAIQKTILKLRNKAFKKPLTDEEKDQKISRNLSPENIIYKLLHKYRYWDLVEKLEKVLSLKKKLSTDDIDKIKDAESSFYTTNNQLSFESFIYKKKEDTKDNKTILLERLKDIRLKKIDWKNPKAHKSHKYKSNRGMDRQNLAQIPDSELNTPIGVTGHLSSIGSAKRLVDIAKKTTSGIWRLTPAQVKWLSATYHHRPPDIHKNMKHLGNTGIIVWRKRKNEYFLVKLSGTYLKNF